MYNCEDIFEKTDAYLDGELSELEYAEFERHLENCEACRNSVEFAKKLSGVMHGMPSVEPPADFLDNLHKKIATEGKAVRFYKKWQPYGALAACLILAVVIRTNVVKDMNESSSYLKMATPEPTAAETVNEYDYTADTAAEESAAVQDIEDTKTTAAVFDEVSPEAAPTASEAEPVAAAVPIQAVPTAEVKTDYVQLQADIVQIPEAAVTSAPTEETAPIVDVPMMLSINEEDAAAAAEATQMPAPEAAAPAMQNNSEELHVGGSATAAQSASVTVSESSPSPADTTSSKRVSGGSGGGSSSTSSGGGGGSASSNGTWISGITGANTPSMVNYISSEYKAEVEALLTSLGIQRSGTMYTASKAAFDKFVTALADKNIPFDGINAADGDNVRFVIEWE